MQNQKDIIVITAVGKSTWLKERLPGWGGWSRMLGEGLVSKYKEKMQILRDVDDRIYNWLGDLQHIVSQMRKAANANRLVDVAILLHALNTRLNKVKEVGSEIKQLETTDIEPFEMEHQLDLPEEDLFSADDTLVSKAGIWSDFKRRWVAKHLENEERRKRKLAIDSLVDSAAKLSEKVEGYLGQLSSARIKGNIGDYIAVLNKISIAQQEFKNIFTPIYNRYLSPIVQKVKDERKAFEEQAKKEEEERKRIQLEREMAKKQLSAPTKKAPIPTPQSGQVIPESVPTESAPQFVEPISEEIATEKEPDTEKESSPVTLPSNKLTFTNVEKIMIKKSHEEFIQEMIKESDNNDPYILSAMLIKYAEQIEEIDLEKSLELLAIAEGIIDDA